jgi:hypothetical protein
LIDVAAAVWAIVFGVVFPPWPFWQSDRGFGVVMLALWLAAWLCAFFLWAGIGLVMLVALSVAGLVMAIWCSARKAE